jgi:serine/threonine protein kinase
MSLAMPNGGTDRWSIVRGLFEAVAALAPAQRQGFLDYACQDADIREEVESLLEADLMADTASLPGDRAAAQVDTAEVLPEIPGYTIESVLGHGGAGSVYAARNEQTGRRVAIKVVRSHGHHSQAAQRFRQECRVLARLSHPGVVQMIETGTAGPGVTYLVMNFLEGRPLDRWLQEERPTARQSIAIVRQILAALAHAHQVGVIHRDVKPQNIMVQADGSIKLVDFGVARLHAEDGHRTGVHTETGHLVGTFAYMSPEQADGQSARIGHLSDVYQAALVLFEMLAGRLPYETQGRTAAGLLRAVLMDRRMLLGEARADLAGRLEAILDRALSIDPAARPQSVHALDAELAAVEAMLS